MRACFLKSALLVATLLGAALPALANTRPASDLLERLEADASALGTPMQALDVHSPVGSAVTVAPATGDIELEEGQVNFEYSEIVDRFESLRRTVVRGKKKKKRVIHIPTGVTPADRVDRGEIKKIVLHASGGAGACDGSVSHLLGARTAAHFMVCRDGRVTRMVKIENIGNHVKNTAVDRESVGIETESGHPRTPYFRLDDWRPESYWRMYASLAWLIRAVAKEANVPRNRASIITHEEADRGLPRAHSDPGPYFDTGGYPIFDERFPGQAVSPREFLMRLVLDDTPPLIWSVASSWGSDQVEITDTNSLGLSHIRIWLLDSAGKPSLMQYEWSAPVTGMPALNLIVPAPLLAGSYRIVARDLVGNTSTALLRVKAATDAPSDGATVAARMELRSETPIVTASLDLE